MRRAIPFLLVTLLIPLAAQQSGSTIPTERIFEAIGVREGVTVCEIGAGDGELSIAAARAVGTDGHVYTSELGEERVKALRAKIADSGHAHITVVPGDPVKTNFPDAGCDAIFMRNVYHHFADPDVMNASMVASLKPGGRLAVVDFTPSSGNEASRPEDRDNDRTHGVGPASVARELTAAGLEPVPAESGGDRWFMVVAAKPTRDGRAASGR